MALGRLGDPPTASACWWKRSRAIPAWTAAVRWWPCSLVPWVQTGVSLDLMRPPRFAQRHHRADGQRVVSAVGSPGINRISLNFAMFRPFRGGARGRRPVARLWRALLIFFLAMVCSRRCTGRKHEAPARMRRAMRVLRGRPVDPAGRCRVGHRRRVPGAAVRRRNRQHMDTIPPCRRHFRRHGTPARRRFHTGHLRLAVDLTDGTAAPRLLEQVRVRISWTVLRAKGIDAYPVGQPPSHAISAALPKPTGRPAGTWRIR